MSSFDMRSSLAVLPSAMLARIQRVWEVRKIKQSCKITCWLTIHIEYICWWETVSTHLLFYFHTVLSFKNKGHCLHYLLPIRTHCLVNMLITKDKHKKKTKNKTSHCPDVQILGDSTHSPVLAFLICFEGKSRPYMSSWLLIKLFTPRHRYQCCKKSCLPPSQFLVGFFLFVCFLAIFITHKVSRRNQKKKYWNQSGKGLIANHYQSHYPQI